MTIEELGRVPFKCVASLSMEYEHCLTYINEEYNFGMCQHTKKKADGFSFGRTYTHYRFGTKVFNSLPEFLEAIKDVEFVEPVAPPPSGCIVIDFNTRKRIE